MKKIILLFLILLIALTLFVYIMLAGFSERREYTRFSLEYYFLTSQELLDLSQHCEDSPKFIYSAADGPKPLTIQLHCTYDVALFEAYIKEKQFKPDQMLVDGLIREDYFVKGKKAIERKTNNNKILVTTTYEYLFD